MAKTPKNAAAPQPDVPAIDPTDMTPPGMPKPWGYHFIANVAGADLESISSEENIANFTNKLVTDIQMVPYGKPQIVKFGTGDKAGYTLVQLIETSNICAHFSEEKQEIYLDVFSCKSFDPNVVMELIKEYFKTERIMGHLMFRSAAGV